MEFPHALSSADVLSARPTCRVCGKPMTPYCDLGTQPLANALQPLDSDPTRDFRAPLVIQACLRCAFSQLTHVVAPEIMYDSYTYFSGITLAWRRHCSELAIALGVTSKNVLEIGSNDGTFLQACQRLKARSVRGIDPGKNFANAFTTTAYWSAKLAATLPKADVIVASNVFGHVDDPRDFLQGVALVLDPRGTCVIEVPYVLALLRQRAFDTIYHEHLSYWSVTALRTLAAECGLAITKLDYDALLHGGTMRFFLQHATPDDKPLLPWLHRERWLHNMSTYSVFARGVQERRRTIDNMLMPLQGAWAGYGAAAKATVLLNSIAARPRIVFDDAPTKQNKRIPGTSVPIVRPDFHGEDALAVFPWNWARQLKHRAREAGFTGRFFVPLPKPGWESA